MAPPAPFRLREQSQPPRAAVLTLGHTPGGPSLRAYLLRVLTEGRALDTSREIHMHQGLVQRPLLWNQLHLNLEGPAWDRGYLLVTGGMGAGKSALLSQWLSRGGNPVFHHVVRGWEEWDDPARLLDSLAVQVSRKHSLDFPALEYSPAADRSEGVRRAAHRLMRVLEDASGRLVPPPQVPPRTDA